MSEEKKYNRVPKRKGDAIWVLRNEVWSEVKFFSWHEIGVIAYTYLLTHENGPLFYYENWSANNPEWVKYELRDDDLKKAYENYGRAMKQMNDVDARYFSKVIDKLEGVEDEVDSMKERAIDLIRRWQAAGESGISARLWVERNEFINEIDGHDRT